MFHTRPHLHPFPLSQEMLGRCEEFRDQLCASQAKKVRFGSLVITKKMTKPCVAKFPNTYNYIQLHQFLWEREREGEWRSLILSKITGFSCKSPSQMILFVPRGFCDDVFLSVSGEKNILANLFKNVLVVLFSDSFRYIQPHPASGYIR